MKFLLFNKHNLSIKTPGKNRNNKVYLLAQLLLLRFIKINLFFFHKVEFKFKNGLF